MRIFDFVGQNNIRKDLLIHLSYSQINYTPLDHVIFYGLPGLGKTTLAEIIATELETKVYQKTGQELNKESLYDILENLEYRDIFFIDEVHATNKKILEILYGPLQIINNLKMEKNIEDLIKFENILISPFTFIGATTSAGMIPKPLKDRAPLVYNLKPYTIKELATMLVAKKCPKNSAKVIAERSRGIPRIALNYFLRIRNEIIEESHITPDKCSDIFDRLGIDQNGYTVNDIMIMKYLEGEESASENELYRSLGLDLTEYKEIYEPFLLEKKQIKITSKGRILTKTGSNYLEKYYENYSW